jgi:CIC family chloride channel protein
VTSIRHDRPDSIAVRPVRRLGADVAMRLRTAVRAGESGLIFLAVVVGIGAGLLTAALSRSATLLHALLFGHGALSAIDRLDSPWLAFVPAAGGLLLGIGGLGIRRWRPRRPVDPIEANALHGGHMSVIDSLLIGVQTLLSNGFGASVGLEAGYTQLGSGLASRLGRTFNLRRADLRVLVGAGSAGAIGAAFGAPLTGAFYAFELVIGTYTPFGLAPVIAAAISGVLIARTIGTGESFIGHLASNFMLDGRSMAALLLLSLACAAIGIAIMRGVTLVEALFRKSRLPSVLQPALGGLFLGVMALVTPHILSAGHGAVTKLLHEAAPATWLLALTLLLKSLASAISIGSGFRGGLFFASLYLGALVGTLFQALVILVVPSLPLDAATCAIVGMAGLSVTIIGGPLTMSFLALETTGDFPLSILILAATTLVSVIVRRTFGYSFATWRLHLRGESIRSAQDVGWIRSLTVRRLMRGNIETTFADGSIGGFLKNHPLGSAYWIVATDPFGRYAGMIALNEAHAISLNAEKCRAPLADLLRNTGVTLTPDMNIREAARIFEETESEALAVVESRTNRQVIGMLTEAHVLRRYTEELDSVRKDLSGETWLKER